MSEDMLTLWVIYEKPRDFPDAWVVRAQAVTRDGSIEVSCQAAVCSSLEQARKRVPRGKVCLARSPEDDPVIVETWL